MHLFATATYTTVGDSLYYQLSATVLVFIYQLSAHIK